MKFFIKLGTASDTPETPDTPPTENAPLHRGETTEIEETHQYIYAGGKLLRETISDGTTTKTLDFNYDNVGMPYSLIYNNGTTTTTYYYITNLQGDVMYLVDSSGNEVAAYDYDPYGKIISATGAMAEINPLRYRGYYYDFETGFYYLQSRYYDPEICRFINADSYASTGQGFTGLNMFAYCNNSPSSASDPSGEFPWITGLIGAAIGGVVGAVSAAINGGDWIDVTISFVAGAASGFIIGATGNTLAARAAAAGINGIATYIDCRYNNVSVSNSLLCASVSSTISFGASSLSSAVREDIVASTLVDCTFGVGGSLTSAAISAGAARAEKARLTSMPSTSRSAYRTAPKVNRRAAPVCEVY